MTSLYVYGLLLAILWMVNAYVYLYCLWVIWDLKIKEKYIFLFIRVIELINNYVKYQKEKILMIDSFAEYLAAG